MSNFNKFLSNLPTVKEVEIKSSNSKTSVIYLKSTDRNSLKENFSKYISDIGLESIEKRSSRSSVKAEIVNTENINYKIFFKPVSGGQSESTLNAAITELFPCIAFIENFPNIQESQDFYQLILESDTLKCYLSENDAEMGKRFITQAKYSTKFDEKIQNAIAIYNYIKTLDEQQKISELFWCPRAKPEGVDKNHPGDIFVKFTNHYIGISLKAGSQKSNEPKLNTYVKPILEFFNESTTDIQRELGELTYQNLGLPESYYTKEHKERTFDFLEKLEENNKDIYEGYYNKNLDYLRSRLIKVFTENNDIFVDFIKQKILKDFAEVPTVVIKAINRDWQEITESAELSKDIEQIKNITGRIHPTRKQQFEIDLDLGNQVKKMSFSIRTNKPAGVMHKLGQFYNLAVKFNHYE